MKTCYKVLRIEDNKLVSCVVLKKAQIVYEENKWIKAPKWLRDNNKGPLVFKNLTNAIAFKRALETEEDRLEIWECQYRYIINDTAFCYLSWLQEGVFYHSNTMEFPSGTMQVKQVKLIRKIENEDML